MSAALTMSLEEFGDWLDAQAEHVRKLSFEKPLRAVGLLLGAAARECFDQGRDPGGSPWAALKNPSARRGGGTAKPLRDTGLLMASLTAGASGNVQELSDARLVYGTNVDYSAFHQDGTATIPARPFLGVNELTEDRIVRILLGHVEDNLLKD
jgi:phage gpG-like protein